MNIWVKLMNLLLCNTIKEPANLNEYEKQRLQTTLTLTYTKIHRLRLGFPETVSLLQPHNKCSLFVWHPGEPLEPRKMKYTVEIVCPSSTNLAPLPQWSSRADGDHWWPLVTTVLASFMSCSSDGMAAWLIMTIMKQIHHEFGGEATSEAKSVYHLKSALFCDSELQHTTATIWVPFQNIPRRIIFVNTPSKFWLELYQLRHKRTWACLSFLEFPELPELPVFKQIHFIPFPWISRKNIIFGRWIIVSLCFLHKMSPTKLGQFRFHHISVPWGLHKRPRPCKSPWGVPGSSAEIGSVARSLGAPRRDVGYGGLDPRSYDNNRTLKSRRTYTIEYTSYNISIYFMYVLYIM